MLFFLILTCTFLTKNKLTYIVIVEQTIIVDFYISQLYNSVVTCRHMTSNSSASAPLHAKKIAVQKVSDIDVVMFGPEL